MLRMKKGIWIILGVLFLMGAVAQKVTKPMNVGLHADIQVYKKGADGTFQQVDEIGPADLQFQASLVEIVSGNQFDTSFVWNATSKNGIPYSIRLSQPAGIKFNPGNGQFDGDGQFEMNYGGKSGKTPGHLTTESVAAPAKMLKGARAHGILGLAQTTATLVMVNETVLEGESSPTRFVCTGDYTFTPTQH